MIDPVTPGPAPAAIDDGRRGGTFLAHDPGAPLLEPLDIVALVLATLMTLGPLTAYALGLGA